MAEMVGIADSAPSFPGGALGKGEGLSLEKTLFIQKVSSDESQGRFALLEGMVPPRMLVAPHVHSREDEITFVVEGRLGAWVGEREYSLEAGGVLMKPRNVVHAMWNPTDEPLRVLEFITPGAYTRFFQEMSELPAGFGSEPAVLDAVAARYGQRWIRDAAWLPGVIARHGLRNPAAAPGR